jgi:hypothetical protein
MYAVNFTPPYTPALVTDAVFYIYNYGSLGPLNVTVLNSTFGTLLTPINVTNLGYGWNDVNLTPYNIVVTGNFFIALTWTQSYTSYLGIDNNSIPYNRSWIHLTSIPGWQLWNTYQPSYQGNFLLRAVVEPYTPPSSIPEIPLGTILGLVACFAALAVFTSKPVKLLRRTSIRLLRRT